MSKFSEDDLKIVTEMAAKWCVDNNCVSYIALEAYKAGFFSGFKSCEEVAEIQDHATARDKVGLWKH